MEKKRRNRIYDHELVQFVLDTEDTAIATEVDVPRSDRCYGLGPTAEMPAVSSTRTQT